MNKRRLQICIDVKLYVLFIYSFVYESYFMKHEYGFFVCCHIDKID